MKLFEVILCIILYYSECAKMFYYANCGIAPQIHLFIFLVICVYINYDNLRYILKCFTHAKN